MASNYTEWYFQLVNRRTGRPVDDDTGTYQILTAATPTRATAFSDANGTSLTQPATMTNGIGRFWLDSATTSIDLTILAASGRAYFLEGVTPSQHRLDVDPEKQEYQLVGVWNILSAHGDGVVSAIGFPLINGMRIKDVFVQKTSAGVGVGAGLIIDFGVSGDPDGFIDGMTSTVTGYFLNNVVIAADTEGGSIIAGVQLRGALLREAHTGLSGITASVGSPGFFVRKTYLASLDTTTNNLVFAINGTSALTTAVGSKGYVFYEYDLLPTAGN